MLANWVLQTTTTTGTGDLSLSASSGYATVAQQFPVGVPFCYAILDNATGKPVESGIGKLTSGGALNRTFPLEGYSGSTLTRLNGSPVNLAAGTYRVICTPLSQAGGTTMVPEPPAAATIRGYLPYPQIQAGNSTPISANTPRSIPVRLSVLKGVLQLGCEVSTAGGTGADKLRIGIYAMEHDGSVGALICETGDMVPSTTGVKVSSIVGGRINLPPGWYHAVFLTSVACNLRAGSNTIMTESPYGLFATNDVMNCANFTAVSAGWSAMPASLSGMTLQRSTANFPPTLTVYQ